MKHLAVIIIVFLNFTLSNSQGVDLSHQWTNLIVSNSGFEEIVKDKFASFDFSKILSNKPIHYDPLSTYTGVFGINYQRIDFHLNVTKDEQSYSVTGKSKLGNNVRKVEGKMRLSKILLRKQDYISDSLFIGLFDCKLREPGDRNGDGEFTGVFAIVFYVKGKDLFLFKTSSGDEPNYTNTFVGRWNSYNSDAEKKVIFSFHPAGLYERLPFCDDIYTIKDFNDDYTIIKPEFEKYGWSDYDYRKRKTDWWK